MKITFDMPDNTKCFHGHMVIVGDGYLEMYTFEISAEDLKDGKEYEIPPERGKEVKQDGLEERETVVEGTGQDYQKGPEEHAGVQARV